MKAVKMAACYVVVGLLTAYGLYASLTAETEKEVQGNLGIALLGATLLGATALAQGARRKTVPKRPLSGIHDYVVFMRAPSLRLAMPVVLVLLALSFYLLDQSGMIVRRPWLASAGMWGCAVLALLTLILPWRLTLRLSREGVEHSPWATKIPWSEIRGLKRTSAGQHDVIVLDLRAPERFPSPSLYKRLFKVFDTKGSKSEFAIMPFLLGGDPDLIAREISRRIDAFGASTAVEHAHSLQDRPPEAI